MDQFKLHEVEVVELVLQGEGGKVSASNATAKEERGRTLYLAT